MGTLKSTMYARMEEMSFRSGAAITGGVLAAAGVAITLTVLLGGHSDAATSVPAPAAAVPPASALPYVAPAAASPTAAPRARRTPAPATAAPAYQPSRAAVPATPHVAATPAPARTTPWQPLHPTHSPQPSQSGDWNWSWNQPQPWPWGLLRHARRPLLTRGLGRAPAG